VGDSSAAGVPIEVWRGVFTPRDVDGGGRVALSAQVAVAVEGLIGAAAALGMPGAFSPDAGATLLVREHQIRLLDDIVVAAPMYMTCGVVEMGESEASLLFSLVGAATDAIAATVLTRVAHASSVESRPFPWPRRAHEKAEAMRIAGAAPPLPDMPRPPTEGAPGFICAARGGVTVGECDAFGRMRPDALVARLSGGLALLAAGSAELGLEVRDLRLVYGRAPIAGDRLELRSSVPAVDEGRPASIHWLVDPQTDAAFASAQTAWRQRKG
jgi:acyl-CoA thioester hydrolase